MLQSRVQFSLFATALVMAISVLFVVQSYADEIEISCPSTINQNIEDSVTLVGSGTCVLASGFEMTNDVTVSEGVSFTVRGTVDGKIDEIGRGNVVVNGGSVNNDIIETGPGAVRVLNGGVVSGKIDESGTGSVVLNNGSLENDALEADKGAINVIEDSFVSGNVDESSKGSVKVDSSSVVEGNVFEEGRGNCNKVDPDSVEGVVDCD